jgi:hypothetical protein
MTEWKTEIGAATPGIVLKRRFTRCANNYPKRDTCGHIAASTARNRIVMTHQHETAGEASQQPSRLDPQITGNVGLYYCCYRLSLMGWNVMPTARNARGVDLIAYDHDASRMISIQVKALSARAAVPLGTSLDKVMGQYWVILNRVATAPTAFILEPAEVKALAKSNVKDGKTTYWLDPPMYERAEFREAWQRIGQAKPASPQ